MGCSGKGSSRSGRIREAAGFLRVLVCITCLMGVGTAGAIEYFDKKKAFDEVGLLRCDSPQFGRRNPAPYPVPDWSIYSRLDKQTQAIYDVVNANKKEMHIQNLVSEGLPIADEPYGTDVELVVYERGGLSSETLETVNNIQSDQLVLDWLRDNPREDWSQLNENIRPIPRKRGEDGKLRVALIFGEHGREIITTETAEYLIKLLSSASMETLLPVLDNDATLASEVLEALDHTVVHIVPCENKQGRRIVEMEQGAQHLFSLPPEIADFLEATRMERLLNLCQRANGRYIDPNRNWPALWGNKPNDYRPQEEYPGPAPLSEPEARLMFRIIHAVEPQAMVNVHSGMYGLFVPPDSSPIMSNNPAHLAEVKLLHQMNERWLGGKCPIGSVGYAVGYVAYGCLSEFMEKGFGITSAQTWEIAGNELTSPRNCYEMFNPIEPDDIQEHRRIWTAMVLNHIVNLYKGMVPGIRSSEDDFSREVAVLPNPDACGLTQMHVDAMDGLNDLALGRGDRQERRDFVEKALARTPDMHMPLLGEDIPAEWLNLTWLNEGPPDYLKPRPKRPPGGPSEENGFNRGEKEKPAVGDTIVKGGVAVTANRAANRASVMMSSYTIMLMGLVLLAITLFVFRRRGRRNAKPRRRYRVWDVV